VAAQFGYRAENVGGFAGDFGADAVASKNCNFETHALIPSKLALIPPTYSGAEALSI
jgi:hypothetical protein